MRLAKANNLREGLDIALETFHSHSDAQIGDKTMGDALLPWLESLHNGATPEEALVVATEAVESTAEMVGKKGRSKYAGEKSVGTKDPGACATLLVLSELTAYLKAENLVDGDGHEENSE